MIPTHSMNLPGKCDKSCEASLCISPKCQSRPTQAGPPSNDAHSPTKSSSPVIYRMSNTMFCLFEIVTKLFQFHDFLCRWSAQLQNVSLSKLEPDKIRDLTQFLRWSKRVKFKFATNFEILWICTRAAPRFQESLIPQFHKCRAHPEVELDSSWKGPP